MYRAAEGALRGHRPRFRDWYASTLPACRSVSGSLYARADYRRIPRTLSHVYYDPLSPENKAELDKIFRAFTSDPSDPAIPNRKLHTWGREIVIPESSSTVAKFGVLDLCGKPMSAADYIEITKNFGTIFVTDVPKMGLGQKDMVNIELCSIVIPLNAHNAWRTGSTVHHLHRRYVMHSVLCVSPLY